MKKKILFLSLLVMIFALVFAISASAAEVVTVDGVLYTLNSNKTAIVTGGGSGNVSCEIEELVIPETFVYNETEYRVTEIAENAFSGSHGSWAGNQTLKKITLPASISGLPYQSSFRNCKNLEEVTFLGKVTALNSYVFSGCSKLATINFNGGLEVTRILGSTFSGCPLTSFDFPENLTEIGGSAFAGAQFTELVLPNSITTLGEGVFSGCNKLTYIRLPENLNQIPHNFRNNAGSAKLTMVVPKGCTSIYSQYSLQNCNITSIIFTGTADSDFVASVQSKASSYVSMITYANHCEIYYGGTHAEDTHPCLIECTRCGMREQDPNAVHTYNNDGKGVINYANGFISSGTLTLVCENEGCECNLTPSVTEVESIYKCLGFSSSMADPTNITLGYVLNKSAYDAYLANDAENVLSFGFVAFVTYDAVSCAPLTVSDGEVTPVNNDLTIFAELNSTEYVAFDFIIRGFSADTMDLGLVMCAYTFDGNEIKYMSRNTEGVFGSYDVAYSTTFSKET